MSLPSFLHVYLETPLWLLLDSILLSRIRTQVTTKKELHIGVSRYRQVARDIPMPCFDALIRRGKNPNLNPILQVRTVILLPKGLDLKQLACESFCQ